MGIVREFHAAIIFIGNHFDVLQTQTAVVGLTGKVSSFRFLHITGKTVVHGDGKHLSGAEHMKANEPLFRSSVACGINGIFQQIAQNHRQVDIRNGQLFRNLDADMELDIVPEGERLVISPRPY